MERAAPEPPVELAPLPPGAPRFADPVTEIWIDEGPVRDEARAAVRRGGARRTSGGSRKGAARSEGRPAKDKRRGKPPPGAREAGDAAAALGRAVGPERAGRLLRRLGEAGNAFEDERFQDAVSILRPIAKEAPSVPEVRELYGLSLYRLGRWKAASEQLEAFRSLTGSTEQHPVLADCYRARRQWTHVSDLWEELREVSPSAELVTEGRIVAAGALADQGRLPEAVALLRSGWRLPGRAQEHHLRRAYALADLEERAGDLPRARELFGWVAATEPGFADVDRRLAALG